MEPQAAKSAAQQEEGLLLPDDYQQAACWHRQAGHSRQAARLD